MKKTILSKLLTTMLLLVVIPLVLVAFLGMQTSRQIGMQAAADARDMGGESLAAAREIGTVAVEDSKEALQSLAQEAIEVRAVDAANRIADFLYERDADALAARALDREEESYAWFLDAKRRPLVFGDELVERRLYREIAFYDLEGEAVVHVTAPGYEEQEYLLDDWRSHSAALGEGELYVSRLWGDYRFVSEAYAGVEQPEGERYEGYYRWVTPVYEEGEKVGYLSLKLDARHVMELAQHLHPTEERFIEHPDAPSGNYAYIVDDEGWLVMHPREYHIKGVLPDGTLPSPVTKMEGYPPLLEDTAPLRFGYLRAHSVELDEIHTLHAVRGESGSQTYPWAGLDKWIAYSAIPYYTGVNYADAAGFGWVAIGAQIDKFNEPAVETAATINAKTEEQADAIAAQLAETENRINERATASVSRNILLIILIILLVVLVAFLLARSISTPIRQLTEAARKVNEGEFDVKLPEAKGDDEVAELTASMEMLVAGLKMQQGKKKK